MKRFACMGLCAVLAAPVLAAAATTPIEASMVLVGTITVNPDGSVKAYTIKDMDKLPPAARQIVQATVPHWQFQPILTDGKATLAKTGMSLRIVADVSAKNATLRVAGAEFGCDAYQAKSLLPMACAQDETIGTIRRDPPAYPISALRAGVGGEVFLTLQVDRNGKVAQVAASQVNLYARHADQFRTVLADSAIDAAKRWTFRIPTTGPVAGKDHWVVRIPVNYQLGRASDHKYGQWQAYVPGPAHVIPWADSKSAAGGHSSNDALAGNGGLFMPDTRFVLKAPLAGDGGKS